MAIAFRGMDWLFFVGISGYLLLAASVILASPLYLQRPIALGLFALALLGDRFSLRQCRVWNGFYLCCS
ncbi:hypothetical protein [[Limnothrix rosea] IAM M-220]|uniref:hypothetical protein n=1 Tax=[Limnothrix rosea] IAM M-220 TaxID=454133 RepID=UPI001CED0506|nr:hypothetical protein [[Limnothrix rosea] IAM M-220]